MQRRKLSLLLGGGGWGPGNTMGGDSVGGLGNNASWSSGRDRDPSLYNKALNLLPSPKL